MATTITADNGSVIYTGTTNDGNSSPTGAVTNTLVDFVSLTGADGVVTAVSSSITTVVLTTDGGSLTLVDGLTSAVPMPSYLSTLIPSVSTTVTLSDQQSSEAAGSQSASGGLDTGAAAGVGVGATLGFVAILLVVIWIWRRRRKAKLASGAGLGSSDANSSAEDEENASARPLRMEKDGRERVEAPGSVSPAEADGASIAELDAGEKAVEADGGWKAAELDGKK